LSVKRAFVIIGISGIAFAASGGAIGYSLGLLSPTYYRAVFEFGRSPDFDPAQAGLGLGLTQGCIAGIVIGAVVVLASCLSSLRQPLKGQLLADDGIARPPVKGCLINAIVLIVGSVMSLPIGLIMGSLAGEFGCKTRRFDKEKTMIASALASDSAMANISIEMDTSDGTAILYGVVATKADLDRLDSRMKTLLGESRNKSIMDFISVKKN
jgi:hypothetical protein